MPDVTFQPTTAYQSQIGHPQLRDFLAHIFQQVDVDTFMDIYERAVNTNHTHQSIYESMLHHAPRAKRWFLGHKWDQLKALQGTVQPLAANVGKLMDRRIKKKGYVEMTMPGRMIKAISSKMGLTGLVVVINEFESRLQSGLFVRPYDEFQTLTYDPIDLQGRKVDVISAFAGLHHCPEQKLDAFVKSIADTLNPGGVFLLRDHDCDTLAMKQLAFVIHSVFNAATGVPWEDEKKEVRHFQSQNYWDTLCLTHGLLCLCTKNLQRDKDSTENGLVKYVKMSDPKSTNDLEQNIMLQREYLISSLEGEYKRDLMSTFTTTVEWINVESVNAIGREDNCYDYHYMSDVIEVWSCFVKSMKVAVQNSSLTSTLLSAQFFENVVLLSLMTAEYVPKALIYFIPSYIAKLSQSINPAKSEDQDTKWEGVSLKYRDWYQGYARRLETVPRYAQSYIEHIKEYWMHMSEVWSKSNRSSASLIFDRQFVKNFYTGICMTVDLLFRAAVAFPLYKMMGDEGDARTLGVIFQPAKTEFGTDDFPPLPNVRYDLLRKDMNLNARFAIVPRYNQLKEFLMQLTKAGQRHTVYEIAGQTEIQIELVVNKDGSNSYESTEEYLYSRAYLEDPAHNKLVVLKVPVQDLGDYLHSTSHQGVHRVCDY